MIFNGERVKQVRKVRNLTQTDVANYIGVTKQAVSNWENNISIPESLVLPNLAKLLNVEMSHFFSEVETEKKVNHNCITNEELEAKQKLVDEYNLKNTNTTLSISKGKEIFITLSKINKIENDEFTIPSIVNKVAFLKFPKINKLKLKIEGNLKKVDSILSGLIIDELDLSEFDITKIEDLSGLFHGTKGIGKLIGLDKWDMTKVKSIKGLFRYSNINEIVGIEKWDTSKIENFTQLFYNAKIGKVNISNWDLSSMITTDPTKELLIGISTGIFQLCKIDKLMIENWDVSNVNRFICWFYNAKINEISDISNWNVSNGINFKMMFSLASFGSEFNISKWNINDVAIVDKILLNSQNIIR
ncbi:MAG: BspA family leucine-rich repeat surface protein [bacterium]